MSCLLIRKLSQCHIECQQPLFSSAILHLNFFKELKEGENNILNSVCKKLDKKFFSISDESL